MFIPVYESLHNMVKTDTKTIVDVSVRMSLGRKRQMDRLIKAEEFRNVSEIINTALTLLLDKYGMIGKEKKNK